MQKTSYLIILFFLLAFMPLPKEEPMIIWSESKLTWQNFHGKMRKNEPFDAVTVSAISSQFSGSNNQLTFDVKAVFLPNDSKKKPKKQSNELLEHEQGHFDITEIFARKLRQTLQNKKFKKYDLIQKEVNKAYNKNNLAWEKMQNQYDKDTDHSKNQTEQKEWNTKIQNTLTELRDFKNTSFLIDISNLSK
jgi:hypothetical protein